MSEKDFPSAPSSSASLPSSASLERLLGAIARGLDGLVQASLEQKKSSADLQQSFVELRKAFVDLAKDIRNQGRLTEQRVADLQVAVDEFVRRVDGIVEVNKSVAKTATAAVGKLENISGQYATLQAESDKEEISWRFIKLRPSTILRFIVKYGPSFIKIIGLIAIWFAGMLATLKRLAPFIKGLH